MKVTKAVIALAALSVTWFASPSAAGARERIAVIIVVDPDMAIGNPGLSDNLTEIAIAELAEGHDRELVGVRELRRLLATALDGESLAACVARAPCLARVGEIAGAARAVIGTVAQQETSFVLALALTETRTMTRQSEVSRHVATEVSALIAAVRDGVADLFDRAPAAPSLPPPSSGGTQLAARMPAAAPPGLALIASPTERLSPGPAASARTRWFVPLLAYGAAGLSVVSFSAAAVMGTHAEETPTGTTRAQKQVELGRLVHEANVANGLIITGTVLAVCSLAAFIWQGHH